MDRTITIKYWWQCPKLHGDIPKPLAEALEESAEDRITDMIKEGYHSGELLDNVNIDIDDKTTPKNGWECNGHFTIVRENG